MSDPTMPSGVTRTRRNTSGPSRSKGESVSGEITESLALLNSNLVLLNKTLEKSSGGVPSTRRSVGEPLEPRPSRSRPSSRDEDKKKLGEGKIASGLNAVKDAIVSVGKRNEESVKNSILGPLRLLTSPIEDFFGGNLFQNILHPKTKTFTKKTPSRNDVAQTGDMGALFLYDFFDKRQEQKKGPDLLSDLGKGLAGLLGAGSAFAKTFAGKAVGFGAIAGALLMAVADGFSGLKKAKDWGVSDPSAFIGGFLGGTKSGFEGAFANMGKWALGGAGAGFIAAGPIGAIIGGLIGAAIGGILGFIGGENIAKGIDAVGKWFQDNFNLENIIKATPIGAVMEFVKTQKENWGSDKPIMTKIGNLLGNMGNVVMDFMLSPFKLVEGLLTPDKSKSFFKKNIDLKSIFKSVGKGIGDFLTKAIPEGIRSLMGTLDTLGTQLKGFNFTKITDALFEGIGQFITGFLEGLGFKDLSSNPVFKTISSLGKNAFDAIGQVLNFFASIASEVIKFISKTGGVLVDLIGGKIGLFDAISKTFGNLFEGLGGMVNTYFRENPIGILIKKYILSPITSFFNSIGDFFSYLGSKGPLGLISDIASGNFSKNFDAYSAGKNVERTKQARSQAEAQAQSLLGTQLESDYRATQKNSKAPIDIHAFTDYAISQHKVDAIQDGIVKSDGKVIHTSPDDTIIATKNNPEVVPRGGYSNSDLNTAILQKIADLLSELVKKPIGSNQVVSQTSYDLEMLALGGF